MGISARELQRHIVQPTLAHMGINSESAINLMMGTAAIQSSFGAHLMQNSGLGLYCMTQRVHCDIWDNYLAFNEDLASDIRGLASQHEFLREPHSELIGNFPYATAIAWLVYQQADVQLPDSEDTEGLARCWANCFVGRKDEISIARFIESYHKYGLHNAQHEAA
ncbi:hypothetical protein A9Q99_03490 [Gammaproteobacteria bacterium 45_16_T64]|nr:hypothetical protein A9Q99_03490 [Gammaproteobacteria bacterium 45_16_T64]